jgi:hypothetical protein
MSSLTENLSDTQKRLLTFGALALAWLAFTQLHVMDRITGNCLVTATGQKLCGGDAKAWCSATDSLRLGPSLSGDTAAADAQTVCDNIR